MSTPSPSLPGRDPRESRRSSDHGWARLYSLWLLVLWGGLALLEIFHAPQGFHGPEALITILGLLSSLGFLGFLAKFSRGAFASRTIDTDLRLYEILVKAVEDYAILMLDPEGRVISWNKGAERLKGYRAEEIIGRPYSTFFGPDDMSQGKPARLLETAAEKGHVEEEGWRIRKDGSRFWADAVITALRDEKGRLIGFGKVTRDLTARKQYEETAIRNSQLLASNQFKNEFVANMSHELRTPLNSIIGYTELVLTDDDQELDDLNRSNLQTVTRNAKHLLSLINDILDLSKLDAGKLSVFPEAFDPQRLIQSVINTMLPLAANKGLLIEAHWKPGLEGVVSDETKVKQILLNLLTNAIKFTDAGRIDVTLCAKGNDRWEIAVRDTGMGIAPEHQTMVFEEFRQLDSSSTRAAGGSGLGLAISRKLARLLGGDLRLESRLGEGSTFILELPRALAPVKPSETASEVLESRLPAHGRRVVLAIDDDPEALRLIEQNLKGAPFEVITAQTGESGLRLAKALKPNAITLDILMPHMDGWIVLRTLKMDPETHDIPVVVLSFIDNKALGFSLGAARYLTKPIDRVELVETLTQLCGEEALAQGSVLIVDDDPDARTLYRQVLEREHCRYEEANDGEAAIRAMEEHPPTLVILDLMMPRVDGFEVLAYMRANPRTAQVPVIVVTAKQLTSEDQARLAGAQRVIVKDGSMVSTLLRDLKEVLGELLG